MPISPAINNAIGIAINGSSLYINQNDFPLWLYRVNANTGTVEQTFPTNPGHGQRLGLAYWLNGNLLFEGYDNGLSVLNPLNGGELQHFTAADLGYNLQTFGVAVAGDTLYLMTQSSNINNYSIYIYSISGSISIVPEPSSRLLFGLGTFGVLGIIWVQAAARRPADGGCVGCIKRKMFVRNKVVHVLKVHTDRGEVG